MRPVLSGVSGSNRTGIDALAEAYGRYPICYQGLAHFRMLAIEATATELEPTVKDLSFRDVRHTEPSGAKNPASSGSSAWARLSLQQHREFWDTMATQTLDAVRRCLAPEEPELRRRGVRHLAVFGSVARGDDRPDSDIDLAVEIEAGRSFSLIRMEETRLLLEEVLRRRVDLGEVDSFRPHVRAAFERERVAIF
jgi:uncharacterized protein